MYKKKSKIKIENIHFVLTPKCIFDLKNPQFSAISLRASRWYCTLNNQNPHIKSLVWLFINRYVKEGQNAPLLNPSALKSHISPCQNLSTHTLKTFLLLELISLPLSRGAFPECLTLPLPPHSCSSLSFSIPLSSFLPSCTAALLKSSTHCVCFLHLCLHLATCPSKETKPSLATYKCLKTSAKFNTSQNSQKIISIISELCT